MHWFLFHTVQLQTFYLKEMCYSCIKRENVDNFYGQVYTLYVHTCKTSEARILHSFDGPVVRIWKKQEITEYMSIVQNQHKQGRKHRTDKSVHGSHCAWCQQKTKYKRRTKKATIEATKEEAKEKNYKNNNYNNGRNLWKEIYRTCHNIITTPTPAIFIVYTVVQQKCLK